MKMRFRSDNLYFGLYQALLVAFVQGIKKSIASAKIAGFFSCIDISVFLKLKLVSV
jgi:hypothetical protein